MRLSGLSLGLLTALLCVASEVGAQQSAYTSSPMSRSRRLSYSSGLSNGYRDPLSTFGSSRYAGARTRADQVRSILANMRARRSPNPAAMTSLPPPSPIKMMLDQRNLLSPRSPLGQRGTLFVGRLSQAGEDQGRLGGDFTVLPGAAPSSKLIAPPPVPASTEAPSSEQRLKALADDYFERGAHYFRNGNFLRSRDCFEFVKSLHYDHPRGYLGAALSSFMNGNSGLADLNLLAALSRMKSLDDIRLDAAGFFGESGLLQHGMDSANFLVKSAGDAPGPFLFLAYFAWIKGDLATARDAAASAAATALRIGVPEVAAEAKRFGELLADTNVSPAPLRPQ